MSVKTMDFKPEFLLCGFPYFHTCLKTSAFKVYILHKNSGAQATKLKSFEKFCFWLNCAVCLIRNESQGLKGKREDHF